MPQTYLDVRSVAQPVPGSTCPPADPEHRDWCWPVAIAMTRPLLGRTNRAAYKIGSITCYANTTCAVLTFCLPFLIAGLRWCWIGRVRPHGPGRCRPSGYRLAWTGTSAAKRPQRRREAGAYR